jgi:hypothetical protein
MDRMNVDRGVDGMDEMGLFSIFTKLLILTSFTCLT